MEFKGFFTRADGGGFCIGEGNSAEAMFDATVPWAGACLDCDITPIVEMDKRVELVHEAIAFRRG